MTDRKTYQKKCDMILCDFRVRYNACKWDTIIPFEPLWEQYERIIKIMEQLFYLEVNLLLVN